MLYVSKLYRIWVYAGGTKILDILSFGKKKLLSDHFALLTMRQWKY